MKRKTRAGSVAGFFHFLMTAVGRREKNFRGTAAALDNSRQNR